jgi:quercetin dioxygenase-like cupin family protein
VKEKFIMIKISEIKEIEVITGFKARFVHTENTTLGYWKVKKGATLPMHQHIHEQITQVEEGEFQLTINGKTETYTKGMVAVIPPNVAHGGIALTDCKLFDIFSPAREDYRKLG